MKTLGIYRDYPVSKGCTIWINDPVSLDAGDGRFFFRELEISVLRSHALNRIRA